VITDVHKGRTIKVTKGREPGTLRVTVNGIPVACSRISSDQQAALEDAKNTIDFIDRDPVVDGDRWNACWYAPGTYELCPEGHPVALAGKCRHSYCVTREERGLSDG